MKALARWIVSKYPQAWRERYEAEVLDLITSGPVSVAETGELFRSMLVERTRAGIDVNQPQKAVARLRETKLLITLGGFICSNTVAVLLRWWRPMTDEDSYWVVGALLLYSAALFTAWLMQRRLRRTTDSNAPAVPVWVAVLSVPVQIVIVGCYGWLALSAKTSPLFLDQIVPLYHMVWTNGLVLGWLIIQIWPGHKLAVALTEYEVAKRSESAARDFVASCEEWIAKGVASPLQEAQRSHDEWVKRLASVETRLKALGYRPGVAL